MNVGPALSRSFNILKGKAAIFVSAVGLPLKQRMVEREFRKLPAIAGIRPVRLYDPCHTAATLAIAAGASVKDQLPLSSGPIHATGALPPIPKQHSKSVIPA
jgi:hypothetical protein